MRCTFSVGHRPTEDRTLGGQALADLGRLPPPLLGPPQQDRHLVLVPRPVGPQFEHVGGLQQENHPAQIARHISAGRPSVGAALGSRNSPFPPR
jgi:hypothetical protein